jgi:Pretoxin HINT domain
MTGELALKPVLQTTIRPPKVTFSIVTDSGEIRATAGHRWFVAGKGWLMTRDLEGDMLLHNATCTTRILKVTTNSKPKEPETYNLIVEGFHIYFVGQDRVLSFDNSEPLPTLRAVPGFGQISLN